MAAVPNIKKAPNQTVAFFDPHLFWFLYRGRVRLGELQHFLRRVDFDPKGL